MDARRSAGNRGPHDRGPRGRADKQALRGDGERPFTGSEMEWLMEQTVTQRRRTTGANRPSGTEPAGPSAPPDAAGGVLSAGPARESCAPAGAAESGAAEHQASAIATPPPGLVADSFWRFG